MSNEFHASRLDVRALAQAGASLSGQTPLSDFSRLQVEAQAPVTGRQVQWRVQGELRAAPGGTTAVWLYLEAEASLPLICQRCLTPADMALQVKHAYRFVATEQQAEDEDPETEEDLLVLQRDFNLLELIEDELLMALPLVPRHEVCPTEVTMSAQDADFDVAQAEKPNPFASLARLKTNPKSDDA